MVGGEDRRHRSASRCSRPSTFTGAKTRASGRIQVGRLTRRSARAGAVRFQRREVDRLGDAAALTAPDTPSSGRAIASRSPTVCAAANCPSSTVTCSASSSAIISSTRSSELKPSSSMVVLAPTVRPGANRAPRPDAALRTHRLLRSHRAGAHPPIGSASREAHAVSVSACPPCAAAPRRPHRRQADLLVVLERRVGRADDVVEIGALGDGRRSPGRVPPIHRPPARRPPRIHARRAAR